MKITVFGSGYVGLVTGTCLAEVGNDVVCIDIDEDRIASLQQGIIPIYEPGLEVMVKANQTAGRLSFTTDTAKAVAHGSFIFIAVGTPSNDVGGADLKYVAAVARDIAEHMEVYKVIIDKSTVPVGTADKVNSIIQQVLERRGKDIEFDVVSNPEFLKEGSALDDFLEPDRIIVGTGNPRTAQLLQILYAPFNRDVNRVIVMDVRSAELTKYAANAMLATKISFINELSNLATLLGADIEQVRHGIGSDSRIGNSFIYPGCGYGGSCFPKDVKALTQVAFEYGYTTELLIAVDSVNTRQKQVLFEKIYTHYYGNLTGKVFAIWGLAFKPNTDDMRDAPSRTIISALLAAGATVRAFDPEALEEAKKIYKDVDGVVLCNTQQDTLLQCDALVIVTEWKQFFNPDFIGLTKQLADRVIFDGRNLYEPNLVTTAGLTYHSIGR